MLSFSASCDPIFIRTCRGSSGSLRARVVGGTRVAPTGADDICLEGRQEFDLKENSARHLTSHGSPEHHSKVVAAGSLGR